MLIMQDFGTINLICIYINSLTLSYNYLLLVTFFKLLLYIVLVRYPPPPYL